MIEVTKRIFIQAYVSEAFKAEYQRLLGPYRDQSTDIRRLLEQEYPSLKELADKERKAKSLGAIK